MLNLDRMGVISRAWKLLSLCRMYKISHQCLH